MASNINPQNIDGTYPIAGQDNNSQGFRDNFTNTKTNFAYAEDEINDLQSKVVLKSALTGSTLDNDMQGAALTNAQIADFSLTRIALGTVGGDVTINFAAGHYQTLTTASAVALDFTNWPAAGATGVVTVQVTVSSTAHTLTLPLAVSLGKTGIEGISGQVITFASTGTFEFEFKTNDGGSTITVFDLNRPLSLFTNAVSITDTTASTSTTTGALVVSGGLGVAGNISIGGTFQPASIAATGNISAGNVTSTGIISATGNTTGGNITTVGQVVATGNVSGGNITTVGTSSAGSITSTGLIRSSSNTSGIGYSTGAGNSAVQLTSKSTTVAFNAICGQITCNAATLNLDTTVTFTFTNSAIANTDVLVLNHVSGGTAGSYVLNAQPSTGSAAINIRNVSGGGLSEAIVIGFVVIKGVIL